MEAMKCGDDIKMVMHAMADMPINSQVHEKTSNKARAQRRARMEPMPSTPSRIARLPYIATTRKIVWGGFCGTLAGFGHDCARNITMTSIAHNPPAHMVRMPKMMRPAL